MPKSKATQVASHCEGKKTRARKPKQPSVASIANIDQTSSSTPSGNVQLRPPVTRRVAKPTFAEVTAKNTSDVSEVAPTRPKSVVPPTNQKVRPTSVMIVNLPECTSTRLDERDEAERRAWGQLCQALGLETTPPIRTTRIGDRQRSTIRPLRVELPNEAVAETMILASNALGRTDFKGVRIYPDVSWSEREARRISLKTTPAKEISRRRSVILHGIPESTSQVPLEQLHHDRAQWAYLKSVMCPVPTAIRAAYLTRLPRPAHLSQMTQPRLLRLTLANQEMVTQLLEAWSSVRLRFSREIRIHEDRQRSVRAAARDPVVKQPVVACEVLPKPTAAPTNPSLDATRTVDTAGTSSTPAQTDAGNCPQPVC
ncbi:MAG: hypothetical protein ABW094_12920 [Candidatus Thiodiazotropha sp.]